MRLEVDDKIMKRVLTMARYHNIRPIDFIETALVALVTASENIIKEDIKDSGKKKAPKG